MELINQTIEKIAFLSNSDSAYTMAECLLSACNTKVKAPSFLDISANLDTSNKKIVERLMNITQEPDYNNSSQDHARAWLKKSIYADYLNKEIGDW